MSDKQIINPEEMKRIASEFRSKNEEWATAMQNLYRDKEDLDAKWDDSANDTYNARWEEDKVKHQQLIEMMSEYAKCIEDTLNDYYQTEQDTTAMLKK